MPLYDCRVSRSSLLFNTKVPVTGLSMTSRGERSAQPPVEIWQQIAGHMPSKAWARLSGTCKVMHSVQPKQISICVSSESALAWVQTHWGQASSLKLQRQKKDIPWVIAHNAATLTPLRRLELRLLQDRSPTTAILLTWLLAQALQLQLLHMQHPIAPVVPPLQNLSHLIMASSNFTATIAASIRQLHNLQTLWLGKIKRHPVVACAEFDLASLPQLSEVCVDNLPIPGITPPEHCRLHMVGNEEDMFPMQGQLYSISVRSSGLAYPENLFDQIPLLILQSECSCLHWWDIAQLGQSSNSVLFDARHFRYLTHLNLAGREIHIVLPQELPLQVLHVFARNMSVVCVNPQEQAKRLQRLSIVYRTLRGTDIMALVVVMCGMGAIMSNADEVEDLAHPNNHHGLLVKYPHVPDIWECPCGACPACLHTM